MEPEVILRTYFAITSIVQDLVGFFGIILDCHTILRNSITIL